MAIKYCLQYFGGRGASGIGGGGVPNEATEWYVSGDGMWINQYLRGKGDFGELNDFEKQMLKELDQATDAKLPDKVLYRSVDASAIFGNKSEDAIYNAKQYAMYGDEAWSGNGDYVKGLRRDAKQVLDSAIGKTITDKGFMSTTSDKNIAEDFYGFTGASNPVIMKINTNGKAKGVNLSQYDKNVAPGMEQKERLLARNTSYKVDKITTDDHRNVIVEVTLK